MCFLRDGTTCDSMDGQRGFAMEERTSSTTPQKPFPFVHRREIPGRKRWTISSVLVLLPFLFLACGQAAEAPIREPMDRDTMDREEVSDVAREIEDRPTADRPTADRPTADDPTAERPASDDDPRPPTEPTVEPTDDPADATYWIDEVLSSLDVGTVTFNPPSTMEIGEASRVVVLLRVGVDEQTLEQLERELVQETGVDPDAIESASLKVGADMQAHLYSSTDALRVTPPEPVVQPVSRRSATEWSWLVTPTEPGRHLLELSIAAVVTRGEDRSVKRIETFTRTIEVVVPWPRRVGSFFSNNWEVFLTVIIVPLVGYIWRQRFKRRGRTG